MFGVYRFEDRLVEVSITPHSSLFSLTEKHHKQNNLRRKEFILAHALWSVAKEVKAEASNRSYGRMLLTGLFSTASSTWVFVLFCFIITQDHLPRCSTTHIGPGPSLSLSNQENAP